MMYTWLIIIILLIIVTILIISLYRCRNSSHLGQHWHSAREAMVTQSYLHRVLMIESINEKANSLDEKSNTVTYKKILKCDKILGRSLVTYLGNSAAEKVARLMAKRNRIMKTYYNTMKTSSCFDGYCVDTTKVDMSTLTDVTTNEETYEKNDINNYTLRRLERVSREITDVIASSLNAKNSEHHANSSHNIIQYTQLFNLLSLYHRELINQTKAYVSKEYDISMNAIQSIVELSNAIVNEFENICMHKK